MLDDLVNIVAVVGFPINIIVGFKQVLFCLDGGISSNIIFIITMMITSILRIALMIASAVTNQVQLLWIMVGIAWHFLRHASALASKKAKTITYFCHIRFHTHIPIWLCVCAFLCLCLLLADWRSDFFLFSAT